jgi:glycosyl transferase family 4
MRILAVVYCLPPLLVPAAMCYLKLLLGLRELGVEVEAVAIRPETFAAPLEGLQDPSLLRLLPEDFLVHWVRSPESLPVVRWLKRSDVVYRALYRVFEPRKREWIGAARRVLDRIDLSRYDAVLTCSQPHANHLLGLELKAKLGVPWIAYFSDPWSRNPYAHRTSPRIIAYHRKLETRVMAAADVVLFTSPEMERLAQGEFPDLLRQKTGVVPHGFVPAWYEMVQVAAPPPGPLHLLHTGHFYGPRTPAPLVRALQGVAGRERFGFSFFGSFPAAERRHVQEAGLEKTFEVHGPVPYLESLALMRQHDALLLVDAPLTDQTESVFLPSKLIDYLGSGKPVIAITPREGATARVVDEVGGLRADVTNDAEIRALFDALAAGKPLPPPDPSRAARYHYLETAGKLLTYLPR